MINHRSNSHQRFISNNLPNNFNRQNNNYYNIPREEIKQINYEANLLKGVDSNLNILLSNLKMNNQSPRIYYPLNSKIKSPMKIQQTNNFVKLDLVDTYNYIIESYAQKNDNYLSSSNSNYPDNLSDFSYPYSYNNGLIINSNNSRQNYNNPNLKMNLSYSGNQMKKTNQNDEINKKRIIIKKNNYERNINLSEKNRNFNKNNNMNRFKIKRNNPSDQNNIRIIPNNLNNNNPSSVGQLNEIMKQLKYLSAYNA